jgi:hypothetical protein
MKMPLKHKNGSKSKQQKAERPKIKHASIMTPVPDLETAAKAAPNAVSTGRISPALPLSPEQSKHAVALAGDVLPKAIA